MPASDPTHEDTSVRPTRFLLVLFLGALAIRWAYDLALFAAAGTAGLMGVDSVAYLADATAFADVIAGGGVSGLGWLGRTPTSCRCSMRW